jgi:hypothetical protein
LRRRFVECPSAYELQELGGVSGGTAALGLRLRLGIALRSALCAARCPEPVHSQALYEPYLLTVSPLLQPASSYHTGSPLLGGLTAATLPSSDCGPKEQLGRQNQPHEAALRTRIPLSDALPRLRALHWVIASLNSSSICPVVRTYALPPSLPPGGWTYVGARASVTTSQCPRRYSLLPSGSLRRGGVLLELRPGQWLARSGQRGLCF